MKGSTRKLGTALTWLAVAALLLSVFGAVPAAATSGGKDTYTVVVTTQESLPAKIKVEDLDDQVKWTIDMDETDPDFANGHAAYGLVIGVGADIQYQIHSNDGTDATYPFGTHLYSEYDSGWHTGDTNTPVSSLAWASATGERDLDANTNAQFTVTIDKDHLNGGDFKWALALMGNTSNTYTPTAFTWSDTDTTNFHSHAALDAAPYPGDETIPRGVVGDAPSGWGNSCWQGPESGDGNKSNYHVWYTEVSDGAEVDLEGLVGAGHGLTVSDLESISYHTKKDFDSTGIDDWWLSIYTREEGDSDDSGSWYDSRLHARPDVGDGYTQSGTDNAWNLWSTDDEATPTNQLVFYDSGRGWNGYYSALSDLSSGQVDWGNGQSHDYTSEEIKSITLQTDSGWDGFDGYIDGLTIELKDGRIGEVNLVSGPTLWLEPADDWVEQGQTKTIDVMLTSGFNAGFNGVELDLTYDSDLLSVVSVEAGSMWSGHPTNVTQNSGGDGTVEFSAFLMEADTTLDVTDAQVARITFQGDTDGISDLTFANVIVSNPDGETLATVTRNGTLEVYGHGTVQGDVELQGRFVDGGDSAYHEGATVTLTGGPGGGFTYTGSTLDDGTWNISGVVEGDYDVRVEMDLYLSAESASSGPVSVSTDGSADAGFVKLLGGDCNTPFNDIIGSGDASVVAAAFGLDHGETGWNDNADINDDYTVNILDCSILGGNYGKEGPIAW